MSNLRQFVPRQSVGSRKPDFVQLGVFHADLLCEHFSQSGRRAGNDRYLHAAPPQKKSLRSMIFADFPAFPEMGGAAAAAERLLPMEALILLNVGCVGVLPFIPA